MSQTGHSSQTEFDGDSPPNTQVAWVYGALLFPERDCHASVLNHRAKLFRESLPEGFCLIALDRDDGDSSWLLTFEDDAWALKWCETRQSHVFGDSLALGTEQTRELTWRATDKEAELVQLASGWKGRASEPAFRTVWHYD